MEPLWVWAEFSCLTFTRIHWQETDWKIGMFLCMRYALVSVDTGKSYALGLKCMLKPNVSHALTSHCIQMWLASTETQCVSVDVSSSALCPPLMSKVSRDLSMKTKSIISYEAFAIFPFLVSSKKKKLLLVLWNFLFKQTPCNPGLFFLSHNLVKNVSKHELTVNTSPVFHSLWWLRGEIRERPCAKLVIMFWSCHG